MIRIALLLGLLAVPFPILSAPVQQSISGGNITAACNLTPLTIQLNADGSFVVVLDAQLNGAHRTRVNGISADGLTFTLDGVPIASPPAALQALGTHLAAASPKITAAYSAAAVTAAVCGP